MIAPRLVVADVHVASEWYAKLFDGEIQEETATRARLALGAEGVGLLIELGVAPPPSTTPVLEMRVDDVERWVGAALAAGARRASAAHLTSYAQVRDPFGYLWAFARR